MYICRDLLDSDVDDIGTDFASDIEISWTRDCLHVHLFQYSTNSFADHFYSVHIAKTSHLIYSSRLCLKSIVCRGDWSQLFLQYHNIMRIICQVFWWLSWLTWVAWAYIAAMHVKYTLIIESMTNLQSCACSVKPQLTAGVAPRFITLVWNTSRSQVKVLHDEHLLFHTTV